MLTASLMIGLWAALVDPRAAGEPPVSAPDFSAAVRPILARHCFKCHGPDDKARKAKLRLDTRTGALGPARSGGRVIVPGKPEESELIARIFAQDETVMPPSHTRNPLTSVQKETLKRWVAHGAE